MRALLLGHTEEFLLGSQKRGLLPLVSGLFLNEGLGWLVVIVVDGLQRVHRLASDTWDCIDVTGWLNTAIPT